jgi:release factor glutamine methyltransferase
MKSWPILNADGVLMLEINQKFGTEVSELLTSTGFKDVKVLKDISGNDRIVMSTKR